MRQPCPACSIEFSEGDVIHTDEMLPGRKYYGWSSCNHYCPHCRALLNFVKPKSRPYIDCGLFTLFIMFCGAESSIIKLIPGHFYPQAIYGLSFLTLLFVRNRVEKHQGYYVTA